LAKEVTMDGIHGVPGNFVRDYLTLTLVLGLAVLQLLNFARGRRAQVNIEGEVITRPTGPKFVDEAVFQARQEAAEDRLRRLEASEQTMRAELAAIRAEMKADREALQRLLREEMAKVHGRVNEVLVAVAELRGPQSHITHPHA
jgi:hypothetical protein